MIKFIKRDFVRVRSTLELVIKRKIPFGIFLIYYVVVGAMGIIALPFIMLYIRIKLKIRISDQIELFKKDFRGEA